MLDCCRRHDLSSFYSLLFKPVDNLILAELRLLCSTCLTSVFMQFGCHRVDSLQITRLSPRRLPPNSAKSTIYMAMFESARAILFYIRTSSITQITNSLVEMSVVLFDNCFQDLRVKLISRVSSPIKLHLTRRWVESFSARTRLTPTAIYARMPRSPIRYDCERKDTTERTNPTA